MAKKTAAAKLMQQEQQFNAAMGEHIDIDDAQAASKEAAEKKAAEAANSLKLSDKIVDLAKKIGVAIGHESSSKLESQELCLTAAQLLFESELRMEGYIGLTNPKVENFVSYIMAEAWITAHPGTEMKISKDQVLNNKAGNLRRIARALTLEGFLYETDAKGEKYRVSVESTLKNLVFGYRDEKGKQKEGRFNPAVFKALEFIKKHEKLCVNDAEYADAVGYVPPAAKADGTVSKKGGREKQAPSEQRMGAILEDVEYMEVTQIESTISAAVKTYISRLPAGAKSYVKTVEAIKKATDQLLKLVKESGHVLNGEVLTQAKKEIREASDASKGILAEAAASAQKTPTHTDEVTSARKTRGRKTATTATVEQGTIRAAA